MKLYIIRHGDALIKPNDSQRPLSKKGKEEIHQIGSFLSQKENITITTLFHSPKLRALQTAQILQTYIRSANGLIESKGLKPLDNPVYWENELYEQEQDIMLISHLPFVGELTALLLGTNPQIAFRTGSLLCLNRDDKNHWSVSWMVQPESV